MELSIIIVNFNGGQLIDNCLESIYQYPPEVPFEVVLVDNASTDGSYDRVRASYPQTVCISETENLGLARAFNQGLRVAKGRYLLSLDNDTRVLPGALQALIAAVQKDPATGIAGSILLNPDHTVQRTFRRRPSALNAIFGRRSLITKLWPSNPLSSRYLMNEKLSATQPFEVDWVSTAALMITRDALDNVGGLDEDFFVYWVDADWCARVKRSDYKIVAVPDSKIIHDENLKAKRRTRRSAKMIKDFHRGAFLYYRKNHARGFLNPMAAVAFVGLSLRAMFLIAADHMRWLILSSRTKG